MLLGLSLSLFDSLVMKMKKKEWIERKEGEECKRCGEPWRERECEELG